jgi:uncharacterized RDD family membrane protein YckC
MFKRRARPARRSHCPVCDGRIDDTLAAADAPSCSHCGEPLRPVKVVGMWHRLAAGLVDGVALMCTAGLLNWALLATLDLPPLLGGAEGLGAVLALLDLSVGDVLARIAPALGMAALYFGAFWTLTGQTPGQRLLKIRVVDAWGESPSIPRTLVRLAGQALALTPAALGWLWVGLDREKQGWHDHLARTWVVRDA